MKRGVCVAMLLMALCHNAALSQYNTKENYVWGFGYYAGLNFNSGSPISIQTSIHENSPALEGCASVSDSNGNLLFYCSADTIWNKNGQVMPNGYGLMQCSIQGHDTILKGWSTTQGALIAPVIDSPNQYYVFNLEQREYFQAPDSAACRLFYSIVDMSLNGGNGDVVFGQKSIPIDSQLSEKMIAVADGNCGLWLLVHGIGNNIFKAYHITSAGINMNPVISTTGNLSGIDAYCDGVMKCSPDRTKIMTSSNAAYPTGTGLELYDFDASTGIVSNCQTLDHGTSSISDDYYGGCFSPDSKKLYVSGDVGIRQYDISLSSLSSIINSVTSLYFPSAMLSDLKLGPDNKIYLGLGFNFDSLDVIDSPNIAGTNCHFVQNAISLVPGTRASWGLPNEYVKPICDLGVKQTTENENVFNVYPNPSNGNFTISGTLPDSKEATIEIFNELGQKVYSETAAMHGEKLNKQLNLYLSPGIYTLHIMASNGATSIHRLVLY
jgi:hypothetical protein